ncbi:4569_t:CDS:1 [Paraglomus occultum]|uniref:4569_t:CDS:1 n=1 Tax=Paraglomus occultum TaxID=144539 RepID=A0A9N9BKN7_9GLOM|nr:4569_t:CDS:1 [Paraglomus occultum]
MEHNNKPVYAEEDEDLTERILYHLSHPPAPSPVRYTCINQHKPPHSILVHSIAKAYFQNHGTWIRGPYALEIGCHHTIKYMFRRLFKREREDKVKLVEIQGSGESVATILQDGLETTVEFLEHRPMPVLVTFILGDKYDSPPANEVRRRLSPNSNNVRLPPADEVRRLSPKLE